MRRLIALLVLAACAPVAPAPPVPAPLPPTDSCNAAVIAPYIGQSITALETVELLQAVRVIRPGEAITMDFLASRLNIVLNAEDVIIRLYCG